MDASLDISATEEDQRHVCVFCDYITKDRSNYMKHVRRQHEDKPSATSTPQKTDQHMCDTCGKTFKSKFGLSLHTKSKHTKEFKHSCNTCGKGFNQTVQYRFHVASHGNIGLEKCKVCAVEFQSQSSLGRHMASCHGETKEKYVCELCQAGFPQKYKLTEHIRGKHGEPQYPCEHCGKRYGWRSSLKAHVRVCPSTQQ